MQDREVALDEAADAKDFDEIAHLVELIDMALHRAQGLVAEARGCVGRGPLFSGNLELLVDVSQTEVEGFAESQEILVEDPTINTRPAAASPA